MKKFVSVRNQYYNKTQSKGLIGHIERTLKENKNVLPQKYIKYDNYYSKNIQENYEKLKSEAHTDYENNNNQSFDRLKNLYIESVVSFSQEYFFKVYEKDKSKIIENLERYIKQIEKEYNIKSCGYSLHLDEGFINKNGNVIYNPHFHISWINYDFENHKTIWRNIKRKDFDKFQDKIFENFKELGFERGISKKETRKTHLKKDKFIQQKHQEQEKKLERVEKDLSTISKITDSLKNKTLTLKKIKDAKTHYKNNKLLIRVLNNIQRLLNSNEIEEKKIKQLEKNFEKLSKEEQEKITEITSLKNDLENKKIEIKNMREFIETLKEPYQSTKNFVNDTVNKELSTSVFGLGGGDLPKSRVQDLKDNMTKVIQGEIKYSVSKIVKKNERLLKENTTLKEENIEVKFTNKVLENKIMNLNTFDNQKKEDLYEEVSKLKEDKSILKKENKKLSVQLEHKTNELIKEKEEHKKTEDLYKDYIREIKEEVSNYMSKLGQIKEKFIYSFKTLFRSDISRKEKEEQEKKREKEEENLSSSYSSSHIYSNDYNNNLDM